MSMGDKGKYTWIILLWILSKYLNKYITMGQYDRFALVAVLEIPITSSYANITNYAWLTGLCQALEANL